MNVGSERTAGESSGRGLHDVDLSGSSVHGAVFSSTKITDAWVRSLELSGVIESLIVNGVEVAPYVRAELERRHPELVLLASRDPAELRRAWAELGRIAAETLATARRLPPASLDESVDGEFSFIQTLRHLVFVTDRWITGPVMGADDPFHRLGYPYDGAPPSELAPLDLDAFPTLGEVLEVRAQRTAAVDVVLHEATEESVARVVASPNGGSVTVGDCIRVVLAEEWWHHRYADRDLATLAARR